MIMDDKFDLSSLQTRINDIKKDGQESADFTIEFLQCLMERHDLGKSIPEDYELDNIPEAIFECLRKGEIPNRDEIMLMDSDTQNFFLFEMIWTCGMTAIAFYTADEEKIDDLPNTFETILAMSNVSPGHWSACYLIAVLTLLMARVPTEEMISKMTNNFSGDPDQIQSNLDYFIEFASALLCRHVEDSVYHSDITCE
jgi:hypothetical protein